MKKKVAIVGTQGVPAKYGGFESLVENIIGENCTPGIQYTIFCSSVDMPTKVKEYKGCRLKYVKLHANGVQSIPYDILSMMRVVRGYDTILVLGTSGCIFLPILKRLSSSKLVVNIDGLEHRREKWGRFARWFLRLSEGCAVRNADVVIADNKGIQDYVAETYGEPSVLIAYGGDNVLRDVPHERQEEILRKYKLKRGAYGITVCRIEPENNSRMILEAFANSDKEIVFIGNWDHSDYGRSLKEEFCHKPNIHCIEAIYDLDTLYSLRANASYYIHGHSAGGTNPSLVEAMFFGKPILAFNVVYNRETTNNQAYYFSTSTELQQLLECTNLEGSLMKTYAMQHYTWRHIAKQYEDLY